MRTQPSLLLGAVLATALVEGAQACSYRDDNGDGLVLGTGVASPNGASSLSASNIHYLGTRYDNVTINLDAATGRWSVTPPFTSASSLDLRMADVNFSGDNGIRIRRLIYDGVQYNATVTLNLDGSFTVDNVSLWMPGTSDPHTGVMTSVQGDWNSSGGQDPYAEGNRRFILAICDAGTFIIDASSQVDGYLYLLDSAGNVIAENDDRNISAGDTNPRIETQLQPGEYTMVVASYYANEAGPFTLSVNTPATTQDPSNVPDPRSRVNLINLLNGPYFSDYASLSGRVTDAATGQALAGAQVRIIGLINHLYTSLTVHSNSVGNYQARIFRNRLPPALLNNTFIASASADGCTASANVFSVINAQRAAFQDFALNCGGGTDTGNNNGTGGGNGGTGGSDSSGGGNTDTGGSGGGTGSGGSGETGDPILTITESRCEVGFRFSFGTIAYNRIIIRGTASGPIGSTVTGASSCTDWSDCERVAGNDSSTEWTYESTTGVWSPQSHTIRLFASGLPSQSETVELNCPTQ